VSFGAAALSACHSERSRGISGKQPCHRTPRRKWRKCARNHGDVLECRMLYRFRSPADVMSNGVETSLDVLPAQRERN